MERPRFHSLLPAHADSNPSLSVNPGEKVDVVLHCHAGCPPEAVFAALNEQKRIAGIVSSGSVTVSALAEIKRIPVEFLESLGLKDRIDGVEIPYRLADGTRDAAGRTDRLTMGRY